jgi:hypothetical protein
MAGRGPRGDLPLSEPLCTTAMTDSPNTATESESDRTMCSAPSAVHHVEIRPGFTVDQGSCAKGGQRLAPGRASACSWASK